MYENNKPLNGICCDVSNCVHNNGKCSCTAGEVHINCRSAKPEETCCCTFREV